MYVSRDPKALLLKIWPQAKHYGWFQPDSCSSVQQPCCKPGESLEMLRKASKQDFGYLRTFLQASEICSKPSYCSQTAELAGSIGYRPRRKACICSQITDLRRRFRAVAEPLRSNLAATWIEATNLPVEVDDPDAMAPCIFEQGVKAEIIEVRT